MATDGYDYETKGYNKDLADGNTYYGADGNAPRVPIGGIIAWCKTLSSRSNGTTDSTSASKLADSGANFVSDGVQVGDIVKNDTDTTWSHVTSVAATELTLNDDIFTSGENYYVYSTPYLSDAYVECGGQVLSDSDSPLNGVTIPDLNADAGSNQRFLRGNTVSGAVGGEDTHTLTTDEMPAHTHTYSNNDGSAGNGGGYAGPASTVATGSTGGGSAHENRPKYYEVVWVMRIK